MDCASFKSEDKNVHRKFLKYSEELIEVDQYLDRYMSNLLTDLIKNDILNIPLFLKQDAFIQKRIIEKMIDKIQEEDLFFIEDKHIYLILDLIKSNKANVKIELPNDYVALKSYNEFKIVKKSNEEEYNLEITDNVLLPIGGRLYKCMDCDEDSNYVIKLNSKEIKMPLYVRSRKTGDKMLVKNLNGSKKVKDIFIDCKIPIEKRTGWPIVVDSDNTILWLPGLKKSKFDKENKNNCDIILKYEEENYEQKK